VEKIRLLAEHLTDENLPSSFDLSVHPEVFWALAREIYADIRTYPTDADTKAIKLATHGGWVTVRIQP
jgi:hypothetical protein